MNFKKYFPYYIYGKSYKEKYEYLNFSNKINDNKFIVLSYFKNYFYIYTDNFQLITKILIKENINYMIPFRNYGAIIYTKNHNILFFDSKYHIYAKFEKYWDSSIMHKYILKNNVYLFKGKNIFVIDIKNKILKEKYFFDNKQIKNIYYDYNNINLQSFEVNEFINFNDDDKKGNIKKIIVVEENEQFLKKYYYLFL